MRRLAVGLAAVLAVSFGGPVFAKDMTEEIQDEEQPGSEIEIGGGKIERENGAPVFAPGKVPQVVPGAGTQLQVPDDPDTPQAGDSIDNELPGEGPEDLSGPDDDDDLPD